MRRQFYVRVCVCVCVCVRCVTLNVVIFSWVNKYYIKKRTNIIVLYFINIIFYFINFFNTNYTFHSVLCIFIFIRK